MAGASFLESSSVCGAIITYPTRNTLSFPATQLGGFSLLLYTRAVLSNMAATGHIQIQIKIIKIK